jgi:hypothetical protein
MPWRLPVVFINDALAPWPSCVLVTALRYVGAEARSRSLASPLPPEV